MRFLDDLRQDVGYSVRVLLQLPVFSAVVVLTLALGIGANTAIFSVVNALLLTPLPYKSPDRLVRLVEHVPAEESPNGQAVRVSGIHQREFLEWRAQSRSLSQMAIYSPVAMTLSGRGEAVRLHGQRASPALFAMLGVPPLIGQVFEEKDASPGAEPRIVLSYRAWERYFGGDRNILTTPLILDGRSYSVTGIAQPGFDFPDPQTEFWVPLVPTEMPTTTVVRVSMIARLADGVSLETATAEANVIGARMRRSPPAADSEPQRFSVTRVTDQLVAPVRPALLVLFATVVFVLLIACANVANLLLARSSNREREIAIRAALGGSRRRLARQVLTETLVLAAAGGIGAMVIAYGSIALLKTLSMVNAPEWLTRGTTAILPRVDQVAIDVRVLLFAAGASLATGLLCSLAPLSHLTKVDPMHLIKDATASVAAGLSFRRQSFTKSVLVVAEIALATVLLVGAGLLVRSFVLLSNVPVGYDPENVLTFQVVMPQGRFADSQQRQAVDEELLARFRSLPRVQAAGATNVLPLTPIALRLRFAVPQRPDMAGQVEAPQARFVSRDYLRAMGVPLVAGRWFGEQDSAGAQPAMIINRALARQYFGADNPVGTFVNSIGPAPWQIIGVVDDIRQATLDREPAPQFFLDFRQTPGDPMLEMTTRVLGGRFYVVRANDDPTTLVPDLRSIVAQSDATAALTDVFTMDALVSTSIARPRFYAALIGVLGVLAACLAAVGIYGVIAYMVTRRTREIGIRMALGAPRSKILALVLGQGGVLAGLGIAIGLIGALNLTQYLRAMLFGLGPSDPTTFVAVALAFAGIAALGCYLPARRATRLDPLSALREE